MSRNMKNVNVPYFGRLQSNLAVGSQVTINGIILVNSVTGHFAVNLARGKPRDLVAADIALHFNPRLEDNGCVVVMNNQRDGSWGQEQRTRGDNLFKKGISFLLKITVEDELYKIEVNGINFATFHHRMGFRDVDAITIDGCVQVKSLDIFQLHSVPPYVPEPRTIATLNNQPIPCITKFHGGISVGSRILIMGSVQCGCPRFEVNLVNGHHAKIEFVKTSNISLHFNPRFEEKVLVMNNMSNGTWGKEVRTDLNISRGHSFRLEIVVNKTNYTVLTNEIHSSTFPHRMPYHDVGLLYIDGAIRIDKIQFRKL